MDKLNPQRPRHEREVQEAIFESEMGPATRAFISGMKELEAEQKRARREIRKLKP